MVAVWLGYFSLRVVFMGPSTREKKQLYNWPMNSKILAYRTVACRLSIVFLTWLLINMF